jgi:nanoRNase/pAp phosphatase (c-di-AMP/oligoRNAs hydrolase)
MVSGSALAEINSPSRVDGLDIGEILEQHRGERHVVILHDFPDPDAISSANAHRLISARYGIEVDILYSGEISHQQNVALVKLLGINVARYEPSIDLGAYQAAIFVDHQGTTVEEIVKALEAAQVPILMVIDHHQPQDRLTPQYSDIRQAGSTATIYTCYLERGAVELDSAQKDHVLTATALMHGILSDTQGFIRASADDLHAAAYLSRFRDAELLGQILNQARSKHAMDIIYRALGNREIVESISVAGIGYVRVEDRDAIPQAADFLMTEENVHTAIVYGMISDNGKGETVIGSIRTSKLTLDPDQFLKDVFGKDEEGRYFGGGRPNAGGFAIPVGFLAGGPANEYQKMKWEVFDAQIKYRIFAKMGVELRSREV